MKNIIHSILFLCFFAISCMEPPIVFEEAQPATVPAESQINLLYRGFYFCESDSALVYINKTTVYKEKLFDFAITIDEVDLIEELSFVNGKLYFEDDPSPLPTHVNGDTISSQINLRDTLFDLGPKSVLKYYKGHQILNNQLGPEKWEVNILSLDENLNLKLYSTTLPKDLEALEKLTPVKDISTEQQIQFKIKPTEMEFGEILKQELIFQECDLFTRQYIDRQL